MRGRKPTPTSKARLAGNPGHRPVNLREPTPPMLDEDFDAVPPELVGRATATTEWQRLAPMLRRVRQVSAADRGALIGLCLEWDRYLEALTEMRRLGMVMIVRGYPMINPYLSIATKALAACNKLWPELGLTPSSRSRVTTTSDATDDGFAEFDLPPGASPVQ